MNELNYFLGGQAFGSIAERLYNANFDAGVLRPYVGPDGKPYVSRVVGYDHSSGKEIRKAFPHNAPATLQARSWEYLDRAVMRAARTRLRVWEDLARANSYVIPDGFGVPELRTQKMNNFGTATIGMNPARRADRDRPLVDFDYLPLPCTYAEFFFDARDMAVSKRAGLPLDTTGAENAGRAMAEKVESLTLGTLSSFAAGSGVVYGYLNFPSRLSYVMASPAGAGWTPMDTVNDFLAIKALFRTKKRRGPWVVYTSPDWDLVLDADYSEAYQGGTLRERLQRIQGIGELRTLDELTGYRMVFVEMVPEVARAIIGMRPQVIRWEEAAGMSMHYLAICIYVPQLRADYDGNVGVLDATAA